jgi:hypothetical protein
MTTIRLTPGDPAPWFITPSPANPRYHFDSVAGRYGVGRHPCSGRVAPHPEGRRLVAPGLARLRLVA